MRAVCSALHRGRIDCCRDTALVWLRRNAPKSQQTVVVAGATAGRVGSAAAAACNDICGSKVTTVVEYATTVICNAMLTRSAAARALRGRAAETETSRPEECCESGASECRVQVPHVRQAFNWYCRRERSTKRKHALRLLTCGFCGQGLWPGVRFDDTQGAGRQAM